MKYISHRHRAPGSLSRGRCCRCQAYSLILVALTLTMTLPFIWHVNMADNNDDRDIAEERLGRFVRSLNSVQSRREQTELRHHLEANSTVQISFRWLQQNNTLPNYFLHGGGTQWVKDSAAVFLHQHRSAGGAVGDCLETVALQRHLVNGPRMTSSERQKWDQQGNKNIAAKYDIHKGQYAFGLCDGYTTRSCFQFTMFRDPMARAVSSYHYCKSAQADEMCKVLNANAVSLKQWIVHQGSLLFQQFTFNSEWCSSQGNLKLEQNPFLADVELLLKPEEFPCWYRHKLHLQQVAPVEREHLLDYIVEHLGQWFTVIGLVEDFEDSIQLLEHTFKVPLSTCAAVNNKTMVSMDDIDDNRANRRRRQDSYDELDDDNDPDYLVYDYEVRRALDADFKIYKKAVKIFQLQRQVMFNDLKPVVVS